MKPFIPANTWVSLKNIGTEPISLTFIFSALENAPRFPHPHTPADDYG
jgi:hypothetical protein